MIDSTQLSCQHSTGPAPPPTISVAGSGPDHTELHHPSGVAPNCHSALQSPCSHSYYSSVLLLLRQRHAQHPVSRPVQIHHSYYSSVTGGMKPRHAPGLPASAMRNTQLAARYRSSRPPRRERQFFRAATASSSSNGRGGERVGGREGGCVWGASSAFSSRRERQFLRATTASSISDGGG